MKRALDGPSTEKKAKKKTKNAKAKTTTTTMKTTKTKKTKKTNKKKTKKKTAAKAGVKKVRASTPGLTKTLVDWWDKLLKKRRRRW